MDNATFERIKNLLDASGMLKAGAPKPGSGLHHDFSEDTVLITGAAGSIGSGLTKLLLLSNVKKLILVDNAETPLFFLKKDIADKGFNNVKFILGDIRDKPQMQHVFKVHQPTIVFHTAAYKHVSIVEENAFEAIKTNIFATKLLSNLAMQYHSKRFIFISTDKAVYPIGIMGMTKLVAENYLSELHRISKSTKFITARFGNIFGSNGSVVPLFIRQLDQNIPISITNKEATRLFIDKNEACKLIITLAKFDTEHYNKVSFDMGEPIKIMDLAKVLISIFEGKTNGSIESRIKISGLSNGEKLHESILTDKETLIPSKEKNIFFLVNKTSGTNKVDLKKLEGISHNSSPTEIKKILDELCSS